MRLSTGQKQTVSRTDSILESRRKIAIILPGSRPAANAPGFGLRYWQPIFENLVANGVDLTVFTNTKMDESYGSYKVRSIPSRFLNRAILKTSYPFGATVVSPTFIRDLRERDFDLIVCIEYNMSVLLAILSARGVRTKVAIFQEHARHDALPKRVIRRWLARKVHVVIGNTIGACNDVATTLGVHDDRIAHIPLLMAPPKEYMCRQAVTLRELNRRPLFLCVSQLIPRKNLRLLLAAADIVRRQGWEFTVWIVGKGPLADDLSAQRDRLGLTGIVEFLGPLDYQSIGYAYGACDVFVLPTHTDVYGMSVLEAMRFGKPILVSSGAGAAGDAVHHGVNGFVFDPSSADLLAQQMVALIQHPELREQMGKQSAKMAENQNVQASSERLVSLIDGNSTPQKDE